jgi:hypothetical protein
MQSAASFGCGLGTTVTPNQRISVSGTFGIPPFASIDLGFQERTTQSLSFDAPPCQLCAIEVCRRDATLTEYLYETGIGGIRHTSIKKRIEGGRTLWRPNCVPDPSCPGCEEASIPFQRIISEFDVPSRNTVLVETIALESDRVLGQHPLTNRNYSGPGGDPGLTLEQLA